MNFECLLKSKKLFEPRCKRVTIYHNANSLSECKFSKINEIPRKLFVDRNEAFQKQILRRIF